MDLEPEEKIDHAAYAFVGVRVLIDAAVGAAIWKETGLIALGIGCWLVMCVIPAILFFGIKNQYFRGRYGIKLERDVNPLAWWIAFAITVLIHTAITGLFIYNISWDKFFQ